MIKIKRGNGSVKRFASNCKQMINKIKHQLVTKLKKKIQIQI